MRLVVRFPSSMLLLLLPPGLTDAMSLHDLAQVTVQDERLKGRNTRSMECEPDGRRYTSAEASHSLFVREDKEGLVLN